MDFEYNIINLPKKITGAGGSMTNVYAFSGEKVMSVNPLGQKRVYLGGMEYLAGAKQHYAHPEGRIVYEVENNQEKDFIQYKITDHLGNLMVLFGDRNNDRKINTETDVAAADDGYPNTPPTMQLEIVQRHFYYAYGMEMEGPWQHTPTMRDAYMYNDKELLLDLGMNLSDYGARYYDAVIGRWGQVDPRAANYFGWSPYNYVAGNPMSNIDPRGDTIRGVNEVSAQRSLALVRSSLGYFNEMSSLFSLGADGQTFNPINELIFDYALGELNEAQQALAIGLADLSPGFDPKGTADHLKPKICCPRF